ncbi:hypothetical protein BTVI_158943 [Pitangus sulphuratus]|nr:hypothetical protein BTVI_158943 [Pitangus sulphuratus]
MLHQGLDISLWPNLKTLRQCEIQNLHLMKAPSCHTVSPEKEPCKSQVCAVKAQSNLTYGQTTLADYSRIGEENRKMERYSTDKTNHTCLAKVSQPSVAEGEKPVQCVLWNEAGGSRAGDALFAVMMTEHRLPREAVESSSLEIFKTHLDMSLSNLLYGGDPALNRWLDERISKGLFQPPMIL